MKSYEDIDIDKDEDNQNNNENDSKNDDKKDDKIDNKNESKIKNDDKLSDFDIECCKELDKIISIINRNLLKGNTLVHCMAGAHRSPFIVGCYMLKYGQYSETKFVNEFKSELNTVNNVYEWLKNMRDVVDELDYKPLMNKYHKYILTQNF